MITDNLTLRKLIQFAIENDILLDEEIGFDLVDSPNYTLEVHGKVTRMNKFPVGSHMKLCFSGKIDNYTVDMKR